MINPTMTYIRLDDQDIHYDNNLNNNLRYDLDDDSTILNEFSNKNYNNIFLMRIYQYYISKGFNNIIIKQVTNLLNLPPYIVNSQHVIQSNIKSNNDYRKYLTMSIC